MNGRKAKAIRKSVYKDFAHTDEKVRKQESTVVKVVNYVKEVAKVGKPKIVNTVEKNMVRNTGLRRLYLWMKQEHKKRN